MIKAGGRMQVFPHMAENLRGLRVLVVDDERLMRWSIAETLAHAGHTVIEAEDGATAMLALKERVEAIDAVVLDYRLPDSNDLALLAAIRQLSRESAVVLMTAFGTPAVVHGALCMGVHYVLHKPFEMQDLESLLRAACSASARSATDGDIWER